MNTHSGTLSGLGPAIRTNASAEEFRLTPSSKTKLMVWLYEKRKGFWGSFELERAVNCPLGPVRAKGGWIYFLATQFSVPEGILNQVKLPMCLIPLVSLQVIFCDLFRDKL